MSRILVLCVDRDDDLGTKAKIKGPIIGKEKNIEAAKQLMIVDPSESDANAIFEGVKVLGELKKDGVDIVTLTGHAARGYRADRRISSQLEDVLKKYKNIDGVYFVTDGADDDQVIPLVQSRVKIISKKTLIVKQAKELEKSYYVIKQVLRDPHFARIVFGLPGVILLTVAFLQEFGVRLIVLAIGFYLLIKGFGIEDPLLNAFRGFRETTSIERASFPLYVGSLLTFILSLWAGFEKFNTITEFNIIKMGAAFTGGFINLFVISVILFLFGRIGDMHYRKEIYKIRKYLLSLVTIIAFWIVILKAIDLVFGYILLDEFFGWVILVFVFTVLGLSAVRVFYRRRYIVSKLKSGLEVFDVEGNRLGRLLEISKKGGYIGISAGKKKIKVPFSRIILVKDYVAVRV